MEKQVLLMTGTIVPQENIKQHGYVSTSIIPEIRKTQYLKSLIFYITQSKFESIIFCENSNYRLNDLDVKNIEYLSNLYGKKIEILQFKGNEEKVNELGYGYGEGECIDYAFDNSEFLRKSKSFYKVTGRYIIGNINKVIEKHKIYDNLFFRNIPAYFGVNTAFFKIENKIYKKFFYDVKNLVNQSQHMCFESVYYNILYKNNLFNLSKNIRVLPNRINFYEDNINGKIHGYNIVKRPVLWYDYILLIFNLYKFHTMDKFFNNVN